MVRYHATHACADGSRDSWNKQKGVDQVDAKRLYVSTLTKVRGDARDRRLTRQVLERFRDRAPEARRYILELESMAPERPLSRSSSTSSFHSSRASLPPGQDEDEPPLPEGTGGDASSQRYDPPDPSLPAPDVAPNIIPPSALNPSHRSLVNSPYSAPASDAFVAPSNQFLPSRPQSILSGVAPGNRRPVQSGAGGQGGSLGFVPEQATTDPSNMQGAFTPHPPPPPSNQFVSRDFGTPDFGFGRTSVPPMIPEYRSGSAAEFRSPYPAQSPFPRPASASTFSHAPLNLPATLQQIQTSLQALHERMSALERSQAVVLRRQDRRKSWFFSNADEELEEAEFQTERDRWRSGPSTTVRTRNPRRRGLTIRVVWALITAVRRAALATGGIVLVAAIVISLMRGNMRQNLALQWKRTRARLVHLLTD